MLKHLKLFSTTAEYNAYTADTANFILPNVSVTRDAPKVVYYNPLASIENAVITCDSATYNGETQIATNIVVTLKGSTLVSGTDYTVSDNEGGINAGSYTFSIRGINNYGGTKQGTFIINKATPTVVSPTAKVLTYQKGVSQELVNAGSTDLGTLKYSLNGETYSTTIPSRTRGGSYTVYYFVEGDSNINSTAVATVACSINEKQVTATVELGQDTYTYDGTAKEPTVTVKDSGDTIDPSEYTVTYSNNINAGTATVTITDNVGGDYGVMGSATFTINKANPSYTVPTTISGLIYNGSAQNLLNAGSTSDGTIQYSSNGSDWGSSIPQGTNADTYTSYWKLIGDSNHNDVASTSISTEIAKVTPTVTAPTANVLTYNTQAQELVSAGSTNWGTLKYSLDDSTYSTDIPSGTTAGTYTVYYMVEGNSNVNDVATSTVACSISDKSVTATVELSQDTYTYDGTAKEPTVTVKDGSTVILSSEYSVAYSYNTNAGTATVTISDNVGGNYNVNGSTTFTINKVTPTVTAPTANVLTYNGSAQTLASVGSTDWGTLKYSLDNSTYSTTIPSGTNADTYTVYYKVEGDSNINDVAPASISTTISKVTPTVTAPTAKVLTYNTQAQELVNAGSTDWGTLKYSLDNSTWSTSIPTATNYGSYTVYYKVDGDSNINNVASQSVACSINEKQVTATVELSQSTYTYNGSACQPTVTVKDGTVVINPSEYTVAYSNNVNAGTATVTISDNVGGNYEVIGSTTFTINKVTPTVTAPTAKSLTYNGSAQALVNAGSTNWGTLKYSTDNSTYSTAIPSGTNATSYTVYYKVDGDSNINSVAVQSVSVTIAKADQSAPTATGATTTYNTTATATASGGGGQGSIEWSNGNTQTSVGSKTTKARWAGNSNYNASPYSNEVTLTMNKANQSAPTATGATVYEGSTATATASGGGGQGTLTWTNGNTRTAIGSQTTQAYWSGNGNYNASPYSNSVTLTVNEHDYVEIGGLKWATMNIGATGVTDYGCLYFQWGDTQGYTASQAGSGDGKKYFGWEDYKYGNGTSSPSTTGMTKYNSTDGKTVLDLSDDAARANWGGSWRMPTIAEFQALGTATTSAWTANYEGSGVAGLVLTSKADSNVKLFFPAAGRCDNGGVRVVGSSGNYWSSSLYSIRSHGYRMRFNNSYLYWNDHDARSYGCSVRGVVG